MIEVQKNYKLTLTEEQAKELHACLNGAKLRRNLTADDELFLVYNELKNLFDSEIR